MVMYYATDASFSTFVEMPDLEYGDSYTYNRGQEGTEMAYGNMSVTDRGFYNRTVSGLMTGVSCSRMHAFRDFFLNTIKESLYTFWMSRKNQRGNADWDKKTVQIFCGAHKPVTYASYKCGDTYGSGTTLKCGVYAETYFEIIGPCRLRQNGIRIIDRNDGDYDISITAVVEREVEN